ncbi:zinc finger, CCHC-type containing protein [Tanacetum coccineum]|uniref:Zinc finger, CCHC-type containing protein n=1 Tax=Tanacetum coccineum TaxID=301880 RepID=A0ABQ5DY43_9ASTR
MTEAKGDGGEGLYVRRRSGQRDMEQGIYSAWSKSQGRSSRLGCYICQSEEHLKRDCPRYNHKKSQGCVRIEDHVYGFGANGYDTVDVMMAMRNAMYGETCKVQVQMRDGSSFVLDNVRYVLKLRLNLISLGTLEKDGFTVNMQSGKIKVIKDVYKKCAEEVGSLIIWVLTGLQSKMGLVEETNGGHSCLSTLFFALCSGLSKVLWAEATTISNISEQGHPSSAFGLSGYRYVRAFWLAC